MKKRLVPILLCVVIALTASCADSSIDAGTDLPEPSDITDTDETYAKEAFDKVVDASAETTGAPLVSEPVITKEEWDAYGFGGLISDTSYNAICALITGDIDEFARLCGVAPDVYADMRGMKIGDWRLYGEAIPSVYDPTDSTVYPVLEISVLESGSEYFSAGTHSIVFDEGLELTFTKRELFAQPSENMSHAKRYIAAVGSDRDFSSISAEGMRQFGLGDFIVARLDDIEGGSKPHSAKKICDYAEKYLGVDGDTLMLDSSLEKVDGGYIRVGRGSASNVCTYLKEEIRDGYTVVTVQFYADYSKTVPSRTVEFYLEMFDWEFRPIKTVIIEDSEFATAYYST